MASKKKNPKKSPKNEGYYLKRAESLIGQQRENALLSLAKFYKREQRIDEELAVYMQIAAERSTHDYDLVIADLYLKKGDPGNAASYLEKKIAVEEKELEGAEGDERLMIRDSLEENYASLLHLYYSTNDKKAARSVEKRILENSLLDYEFIFAAADPKDK